MAESKVKRENYITVQGFMLTDLKLKGNELLIYACIYGFSQTENQVFNGGLQYLADWVNSTKQSVIKCLKSLEEKGYIIKKEKYINGVKSCEYYTTELNTLLNKVEYPIKQSLTGGIKQSLTNNIELDKLLDNIKEIVGYLNAKLGTRYLPANEKTQRLITARFNENKKYTVADFKEVIDKKVKEWKGTEMEKYLRPETLFGTKFESYLNQKEATGRNSKIGEYMQRDYSKDDYEKMFEKATDFSGEDIE